MACLGDKNINDVVTIKENGVAVQYVIKQKGKPSSMYSNTWNGGVLVVRLYLKEKQRGWNTVDVNDYEKSEIDAYLNENFLAELEPTIAAAIMTVKIPFKKGKGNDSTGVMSGENGLARKIFLLSGPEVGCSDQYMSNDGTKLAGFSDAASRACTDKSNSISEWWLRSPSTWGVDGGWMVNWDGSPLSKRVSCYYGVRPAFVLPANLIVKSDGSVTVNTAPTIYSNKTGNLGTLTAGFTCNYSVNDVDAGDNVAVTLTMDSTVINTFTATKGQQYTYSITGDDWLKITNGSHTFKITASDGKASATSTATFIRACNGLTTTLSTPLVADALISVCTLNVEGYIPEDAVCLYEVTNNAKDNSPVWEDCTGAVKNGLSHIFGNKTAANGFAFNFRVKITRGSSNTGGFITKISGGFE